MGMEFRPYYFAREWVRMGHKVSIIAASYSHLRRRNPKVRKDFQHNKIDGIDYYWVRTGTYEGNGAKRAVTMGEFVGKIIANAKNVVRNISPDVVICSSTYPLDTYAGQAIRKASKKPVVLVHEVHDMWPATLIEIGGMKKTHPFVVAMQIGENSAYKHSDYVVSLAAYTEDYMKQHGLGDNKFANIPLGVDLEEWRDAMPIDDQHRQVLEELQKEGKFVVGYFGGHAMSNALGYLIEAAAIIQKERPEIHFVLVGSGVEKKNLIEQAESLGLNNITFLPPVDKREIPSLVQYFDCTYIGAHKTSLYRFGLCLNKMLDCMLAGKPIVSSITAPPTWADEAGCALSVESGNVNQIVEGIEAMEDMDPEERKEMGAKGKAYAEANFSIEELAGRMIEIFNTLLK